ncbi:MAG: hypothetical protein JWR07_5519 [Nevskia sp.]|nr:hypothetical protein [Nevskia sp.]
MARMANSNAQSGVPVRPASGDRRGNKVTASTTGTVAGILSLAACALWVFDGPLLFNLVNTGALSAFSLFVAIALVLSLLTGGIHALRCRSGKVAFPLALVFTVLTAFAMHFFNFLPTLALALAACVAGLVYAFGPKATP